MPWKDTGYRVPVQTMAGHREEARAEEFVPDDIGIVTQIHPTVLALASQVWESHEGRQYVAFEQLLADDPSDCPLAFGVAVFENNELVAIAYMPLHRNFCDGCGLRYEKGGRGKTPVFLFSSEEYATTPRSWEEANEEAILDMHEVWESFCDPTCIRFRTRLALSEAHIFGFIAELPEGYYESDRASRKPVPGRLTDSKLRQLVADGKVKVGDTIFIEGDEPYWDTAPDRKAVVKEVGIKGYDADTHEELPDRSPGIVAEFPLHRPRGGQPWEHPMFPRFLCYRDGKLIYAEVPDDEWFPDQYTTAEQQGQSW